MPPRLRLHATAQRQRALFGGAVRGTSSATAVDALEMAAEAVREAGKRVEAMPPPIPQRRAGAGSVRYRTRGGARGAALALAVAGASALRRHQRGPHRCPPRAHPWSRRPADAALRGPVVRLRDATGAPLEVDGTGPDLPRHGPAAVVRQLYALRALPPSHAGSRSAARAARSSRASTVNPFPTTASSASWRGRCVSARAWPLSSGAVVHAGRRARFWQRRVGFARRHARFLGFRFALRHRRPRHGFRGRWPSRALPLAKLDADVLPGPARRQRRHPVD